MPIPSKVLTLYGAAMLVLGALGLRTTWSAFRTHVLPDDAARTATRGLGSGTGCFVAIAALLSVGCVIVGVLVVLHARSH